MVQPLDLSYSQRVGTSFSHQIYPHPKRQGAVSASILTLFLKGPVSAIRFTLITNDREQFQPLDLTYSHMVEISFSHQSYSIAKGQESFSASILTLFLKETVTAIRFTLITKGREYIAKGQGAVSDIRFTLISKGQEQIQPLYLIYWYYSDQMLVLQMEIHKVTSIKVKKSHSW